jgi:sec-independent protein translocase protein TatC
MDEKRLTFVEHLGDLRKALMFSGLALLVGFCIAIGFWRYLDKAMMLPIAGLLPEGSRPVYVGIFEPIFYMLKLGFIGGLLLSAPAIFGSLWWFIAPGLYPRERRMALPFILAATLFFFGGAAFCYFIVLPNAARFSIGQMTDQTTMLLGLSKYLSNAIMFILVFGLAFETPVIVFLIAWIGIVEPKTLGRYRKYVLIGAFIVGAILTPTPDAFNQAIMAVPIYVLFELGVLAARLVVKKRKD